MKFNKWQIVGIILLSLSFFFVYSCKNKFNRHEAEKALIRHELEKKKDHIRDRLKNHIDKIKPEFPHPFE